MDKQKKLFKSIDVGKKKKKHNVSPMSSEKNTFYQLRSDE